ncbi:MAG: hypothetical protein ACLFVJ_07345 [Persicimonas sp.]
MPAQVDYIIKGSPRAEDALKRFMAHINGFEKLGPQMHRYLRKVARRTFSTEGREIGESWPWYTGSETLYGIIKHKLVAGTVVGRRGQQAVQLLRWKPGQERLFPSVVSARHPEHVWHTDNQSFTFGTRVPYARNHQEGKGRGPWWAGFPKIKQRRFLGLSRKHVAEIRRMISRFIGI